MPTVLTIEGFRFFFYGNDHEPIHVHVAHGDGEAVFNVADTGIALRESKGMKIPDLSRAAAIATENRELIEERWHAFFKR